jgi:hypothetical protein
VKRFFIAVVLLAVLGGLVVAVPMALRSHDDAFDDAGLLTADAERLRATVVTPHLETPIDPGKSVLYCGTFPLAWNELCALIGEDVQLDPPGPEMVGVLNRKEFTKDQLDAESYVAVADFMRNDPHGRIRRELDRKFGGAATPRFMPPAELTPRPQDIVSYCYLFKNLEFKVPFERAEQPIRFGGAEVPGFGISRDYKPDHEKMYGQVRVLDYHGPDDFIVELVIKSEGDRLILAKIEPGQTLGAAVETVQERTARAEPSPAGRGDVLRVPRLNFDLTRRYRELEGRRLVSSNPGVADDLILLSAVQNTRFQLDEKGVRLRSESHTSFGCGASPPPHVNRVMVFDKPFLILLQRAGASLPYFALWVDNPEILGAAPDG